LAGVQVGHSADQFATGETRILTLADTEVLDDRGTGLNDAEDVLVDVHFAESDRRKFLHNESKRKRYDVYEAAESVSGARPLLDFYDERHAGSGSIRLDDAGGMDVSRLEREAAIERQLEAQRSGRVLYELSSLKDPVIASDTRAPEEIIASTFKKPRTKKKRTKERTAGVSTADLIAEINSSSGGGVDARGADRGSRAAREHVADEDTADVAEAAAIARAKREAYEAARGKAKRAASARLGAPGADDDDGAAAATTDNDAGAAGADDDDDNGDEQLYAALERARRTATAAPTDVAATILARQAKREADASSARGKGIVYTDTTQFISTLDAQVIDEDEDGGAAVRVKPERSVKAEVQAEPEVNDEPQPDMDMDVDDKAVAESNNNDNDADANASEDGGVTSVMGQQTSVAIGIGSALAMLRSQGDKANPDDIIVGRRTDERIKRTKDDINKPLDTGAPTAERARHAAAQSSRAVPASERRQFNFELKYTDDEGRELTTKEAYRHLSYKFHGIAPSANKREKYAKQREEELAARQVAENVEETALKLERLQKKKKTAGIELKHL
jgi:U4/U6.U5 tri-snRNP-associated protein 1